MARKAAKKSGKSPKASNRTRKRATAKQRSEAARKAARARWNKSKGKESKTQPTGRQRQGIRPPFTDEKRRAFLEALAECPIVKSAAKKIGVSRRHLYNLRQEDKQFAKEWDEAKDKGIDALEDEALRRAMKGTLRPVYQGGKKVGTVRDFSDTLAIFLLKGNRPEKYRDRHELSGPDGAPLMPGNVQIILPDNGRNDAQPPGGGGGE